MLISYALVLGLIALIISLVVPRVIESVAQLVSNFDSYYFAITGKISDFWKKLNLTDEARAEILDVTNKLFVKIKELSA